MTNYLCHTKCLAQNTLWMATWMVKGRLWLAGEEYCRETKKTMALKWERKKVYSGTVAKYKFEADREIKIVDARLRSLK